MTDALDAKTGGRSPELPVMALSIRPGGSLRALATPCIAACIAACSLSLTPAARAELPPYVYAEEQRQAEAVLRLRVLSTLRRGDQLEVQARVLAIRRQRAPRSLNAGQRITLRYALPIWRRQGWVGPSPVPVLKTGEEVTAWLDRDPAAASSFRPAAGGLSFGPSLEATEPVSP